MESMLSRISPVLHLTRVSTAFAAVSNVWFIVLWTRANEAERRVAHGGVVDNELWVALAGGVLLAMGLYCYAMALNDTLDLRRDRALHPDRPLPSGRVSIESAVGLVAGALIAALLGAVLLGIPAVLLTLLTAVAILGYNAAAKYVPSVGLVLLSLIYGAYMVAANAELLFVWPVWLAMTHALIVGALTYRFAGRRPTLNWGMLLAAGMGWVFWSGVLFWVAARRGAIWPQWVDASAGAWVGAIAAGFAIFVIGRTRGSSHPQRTAEKIQRYGAWWLSLYGVGWMIGQGLQKEALILATLSLGGLIGMTALREIYGLLEHPVGYRR